MASVSVVIPNFNYERFLPEAIRSVLAQTLEPFEIIVVDDGSSDSSVNVAKPFGPLVQVVEQQNRGVSYSRNVGARRASGKYVAFLDADDRWYPEKLQLQLDALLESGKLASQTGYRHISSEGRPGEFFPAPRRPSIEDSLFGRPSLSLISSTLLIDRQFLLSINGFDERFSTSADFHLGLKILHHDQLHSLEECLTEYRVHRLSMHRNVEPYRKDMAEILDEMTPPHLIAQRRKIRCVSETYALKLSVMSGSKRVAFRLFVKSLWLSPAYLAREIGVSVKKRLGVRTNRRAQ